MTDSTPHPAPGTATTLIMVLLGLLYPVLAHLAALSREPWLIAASIGLLVVLILLPALLRRRTLAWLILVGAAWGIGAALGAGRALALLMLPPVLLNACMAWIFGRTLQPGRMPLIERAARLMRGPGATLAPDVVVYARSVTLAWVCLFMALAALNLLLALVARPGGLLEALGVDLAWSVSLQTWSLTANVLSYLGIGLMFVIEFAIRGRRFPQQPYRGFLEFARSLSRQRNLFRPAMQVGKPRSHGVADDRLP